MQIIQGSKFADYFICFKPNLTIGSLKEYSQEHYYNNTLNVSSLSEGDVIYCKIDFINQLFETLIDVNVGVKLVTHNGDRPVNESAYKNKPKCIKAWWGQNIAINTHNLFSLPIGLENIWINNGTQYKTIVDNLRLKTLKTKNQFKNLLYINHRQRCNLRTQAYSFFEGEQWVTKRYNLTYTEYVKDIIEHRFVLCPNGNGIDTHRLWETLYLGTIPIVFESVNSNFYRDLPICFINSYTQVTRDFLDKEYERIINSEFVWDKLDLNYWVNIIKDFNFV